MNIKTDRDKTVGTSMSKAMIQPIDQSLVTWVFDQTTSKFKLNIKNNGVDTPAVNGFYTINKVETQTINNVPTQVTIQNTYYFDASGTMLTGWVKTIDNKTYFFENAKTQDEGEMIVGWKQIGTDWYYFNQDGSMLSNAVTPDGYNIGADGKMIK